MAGQTLDELRTQAQAVKNETADGANTATRVGTYMEDNIDSLQQQSEAFTVVMTFDRYIKKLGPLDLSGGSQSLVLNPANNSSGASILFEIVANGTNSINVTNDFIIVGNSFVSGQPLPADTYDAYLYYDGSKARINIVPTDAVVVTAPLITGLSIANDSTYADVSFSQGIYGANDGSSPALLADFNIVFAANGGTATGWTASSVKQNDSTTEGSASNLIGGETTIRVFGALAGTADGNETLTVSPVDGNSLFNGSGVAMDAGQSAQDNFGSGAFNPNDITIIHHWYDATGLVNNTDNAFGTVGASGEIQLIKDRTPNARNGSGVGHTPTLTGGEIIMDGVDDYFDMTGFIASLASDTQGHVMIVGRRIAAANQARFFGLSQFAGANSYVTLDHRNNAGGSGFANKPAISLDDSGLDRITGDNEFDDTTIHLYEFNSDSTEWEIYVDNVLQPVTAQGGSNSGKWFGDLAGLDEMAIGRDVFSSTVTYYNFAILEWYYFSGRPLTTQERSDMTAYLKGKHPSLPYS